MGIYERSELPFNQRKIRQLFHFQQNNTGVVLTRKRCISSIVLNRFCYQHKHFTGLFQSGFIGSCLQVIAEYY